MSYVNDNASNSTSFKHKTKITEKITERPPQPGNKGHAYQPARPPLATLNIEVTIPLKYLSSLCRSLDLPLIICEVELTLSWTKVYILVEHNNNITSIVFKVTNTKLYVLVVTLSINDNIKFLENIKQGFKRTVSWNKYRSEITTQPKNNKLDYTVDPTFKNINRLFVLLFKNGDNDSTIHSFHKYYMPLVEIKDFNALIDNKLFFDQPLENKQEAYKQCRNVKK